MMTQELIELAVLDAMGLLDETEREEFDAAFAKAAPAIQAQVRREQTRLSLSQDLLPDVEPPAGLRALVIEAVRKAMASKSGGGAERRHRRIAGGVLALVPAAQVSPWWRAASVGFAAAAMVLGVTFLQLRGQLDDLNRSLEADRLISEMQSAAGSAYVTALLTDSQTLRRNLVPAQAGVKGEASIWTNESWDEGQGALLAMVNLPKSERAFRVVTFTNGQMGENPLVTFEGQPGLQMVRFVDARVDQPLAIAAWDPTSGSYQPIMIMPSATTGGLAWGGPLWDGPVAGA